MTGLTSLIVNKPINCNLISKEIKEWSMDKSCDPGSNYEGTCIWTKDCTIIFRYWIKDMRNWPWNKIPFSLPKKVLAAVSITSYNSQGRSTFIYFDSNDNNENVAAFGSGFQRFFVVAPMQKIRVRVTGSNSAGSYTSLVFVITILDILEGDSNDD